MIPHSVSLNSICLKGLHYFNWDKIGGISFGGQSFKSLRFMNLVSVKSGDQRGQTLSAPPSDVTMVT